MHVERCMRCALCDNVEGAAVDWRALYQWREEQYEAKLRASGERLRQRTAAESSGRDSRSIQVLPSSSTRTMIHKTTLVRVYAAV